MALYSLATIGLGSYLFREAMDDCVIVKVGTHSVFQGSLRLGTHSLFRVAMENCVIVKVGTQN